MYKRQHVNTHEAGAIECTGHKVLTCPSHNGKLDPGEVRAYAEQFYADQNREHMVYPGMVYICLLYTSCIFHGELEPPEVGSRCVDEAASELYEDLSEDRGEERYEDPGDR